jgi:hypothetical protein
MSLKLQLNQEIADKQNNLQQAIQSLLSVSDSRYFTFSKFDSGLELEEFSNTTTEEQTQIRSIVEKLHELSQPENILNGTHTVDVEEELELEKLLHNPTKFDFDEPFTVLSENQTIELEEYYQELIEEEEEKKTVIYYYVQERPQEKRADYYIFTPDWVTIMRVPQQELGNGVLGVAYLGTNVIKILDTLHGQDFVEVKKHEILHLQYPNQSESWIRRRTAAELPFETKYQL